VAQACTFFIILFFLELKKKKYMSSLQPQALVNFLQGVTQKPHSTQFDTIDPSFISVLLRHTFPEVAAADIPPTPTADDVSRVLNLDAFAAYDPPKDKAKEFGTYMANTRILWWLMDTATVKGIPLPPYVPPVTASESQQPQHDEPSSSQTSPASEACTEAIRAHAAAEKRLRSANAKIEELQRLMISGGDPTIRLTKMRKLSSTFTF